MTQRRIKSPLHDNDTQICEAFILKKKKEKLGIEVLAECIMCEKYIYMCINDI